MSSVPDIDSVFADAPLMLALAQITFTQSPEIFTRITEVKSALATLGMPIAQKRQQTNFSIKTGGGAPQVTQNELWWFSSLDRKRAVAIAQNSITFYDADYQRFPDFMGLLRIVVDSVVTAAGEGCFLTMVALRYLSGFPSDGDPTPYLASGLQGIPTESLQTDHFHHKYDFWCATASGGRLALNVKTVHGNELVPKEFQAAGVAIDRKFGLPREIDAIQLDIHETVPRKEMAKFSAQDIETFFAEMRLHIKTAFLLLTTKQAHTKWNIARD